MMPRFKKSGKGRRGHGGARSKTSSKTISEAEEKLFIETYEKPAQIYRFLRYRHILSPIFLHRTLTYMEGRMSRNHKHRKEFKVDSLLAQLDTSIPNEPYKKCMNLVLFGLNYKNGNGLSLHYNNGDAVMVDIVISKIIRKTKHEDSVTDVFNTTANLIWNLDEDNNDLLTVSFPMEKFLPYGDEHIIFKLVFFLKDKNLTGGDVQSSDQVYSANLCIYDNKCGYVTQGEYVVVLVEQDAECNKVPGKVNLFEIFPSLKFRLLWSRAPLPPTVNVNDLKTIVQNNENSKEDNEGVNGLVSFDGDKLVKLNRNYINPQVESEKVQILYNLHYNKNTRVKSEYVDGVQCLWCAVDCLKFSSLLTHLKLCHPRFEFSCKTVEPITDGSATIEVKTNNLYYVTPSLDRRTLGFVFCCPRKQ